MTQTKASKARTGSEPDTSVALSKLMKEAPTTREQHSERMIKRGDVRRKVEDLLLEKSTADLW
ncbi:hypothetical protein [Chitinimonas sp.]|uniref:hypothetical protein n=1 Tax=Chitinimonas sp. TaxID=1934313 RepID=UPI0035AF79C7